MCILEKIIFKNYLLGIDIDILYLELLEETLQTKGKNLFKIVEDET